MSQVSAPVRIVALVGVLAALAMGAWMMTQGGAAGAEDASAVESALTPVAQAKATAAAASTRIRSTAAGKHAASAAKASPATKKPAAKTSATASAKTAKPVAATVKKPAAAKLKLPAGTPTTIAGQLALHEIVIVLLYDPGSKVDAYSLAETRLGAREAGAGFLRVNVRSEKQAAPFTKAYGVLQDPTLLFFKRPGKLALKLTGFADHETVAQAAANAGRGLVPVAS